MSTGTWKATDTTSSRTSNESVRVTSQVLLVGVLVSSQQKDVYESSYRVSRRRCMSHSLCVIGVYDEVKMTVPMIVRYVHSK
jgi:hypothetical protein